MEIYEVPPIPRDVVSADHHLFLLMAHEVIDSHFWSSEEVEITLISGLLQKIILRQCSYVTRIIVWEYVSVYVKSDFSNKRKIENFLT